MKRAGWGWILWSLICSQTVWAMGEYRDLFRGARATAMGNAFTAIADDEQALYMNPAGLAGVEKYRIQYLALTLEAPPDLLETVDTLSTMSLEQPEALNTLMGKHLFAHAQLTPTLIMPNFAVGIIADQRAALYAKNQSYPQLTVGYQTTNGVQAGYGVSLFQSSRRNQVGDLRVGVGGKILWRRGGYHTLTLTELFTQLGQSDVIGLKNIVTGEFGRGYGFDLGMQYVRKFGSDFTLSAGSSWTEIGDISFDSGSETQKGNLSAGLAFAYRPGLFSMTFAYDYRHILNPGDWDLKQHFGLQLGLPMLTLYGGLNQFHPTYGISFNAWLAKVTAVSYREELGSQFREDSERRYLLQVELAFGL